MKIAVCVLVGLSLGVVAAQDFRDVSWGASKAEVREAETFELLDEVENKLVFEGEVAGLDTGVVYTFLPDDRLVSASYIFVADYTNDNRYIDDFENVEEILQRVYGEPFLSDIQWSNDLYEDDPSSYGLAVSAGHAAYRGGYRSENTTIAHVLSGNNFEIQHVVDYSSNELADDAEESEQQSEDEAF